MKKALAKKLKKISRSDRRPKGKIVALITPSSTVDDQVTSQEVRELNNLLTNFIEPQFVKCAKQITNDVVRLALITDFKSFKGNLSATLERLQDNLEFQEGKKR